MPSGLGVDVVNISRIKALPEGVKRRIFHPAELAEAASMAEGAAAEYLSGRFAAKEALGKALGCGIARLIPTKYWWRTRAPLSWRRALHLVSSPYHALHHDDPVAVAVVLLSGGSDGPQ